LENEAALLLLAEHLAELDLLPWHEKHETVATNLLAGNVFDWGAKEAAALMQMPGFGFQQALQHLQSIIIKNNAIAIIHSIHTLSHTYTHLKKSKQIMNIQCTNLMIFSLLCFLLLFYVLERPWFIDHVEKWLSRLKEGPCYRCAAIFVDNSGLDVILGVLPFARELLKQGTKVRAILPCQNLVSFLSFPSYFLNVVHVNLGWIVSHREMIKR
jgi:type II pantothenate kinase